jgi:peptidoglycan/LPS O-acetylase OafA/YrhL
MKYEPAFDGLRAIAVISVAVYHAWATVLPGGWAGVDVFFVLSGFLITSILSSEIAATGGVALGRFYLNRALRLTPAFASLLLAMLLKIAVSPAEKTGPLEAVGFSAIYMMNWNRAFDWAPQYMVGHTWSLAMEEQFYLVWPALLLLIFARRPMVWTSGLIVLVAAWRFYLAFSGSDPERTYNGFDTHGDALLIGCLLSFAVQARTSIPEWARHWYIPAGGLAAIFLFLPHRTVFTQTVGLSLAAVLSAWMIVVTRQPNAASRALSAPALVYVGKVSYGFYLWHYPVLMVLGNFYGTPGKLAALALSLGIASASYHWFEMPFLRMKKRFDGHARPVPVGGLVKA